MRALLDHFEQIAECGGFSGLGMHEEDRGSARTFAWRRIDDLETVLLQVVEGFSDVGNAQGDMREAAASAVLLDLLGNRRFRAQRFQQLHEVGAIADLEKNLADL